MVKSNSSELSLRSIEQQMEAQQEIVSCQANLRAACFEGITADDMKQIVQGQVEKAKQGDQAAINFVMKFLAGAGTPITIKQTNILTTDVETAARIAKAANGNPRLSAG